MASIPKTSTDAQKALSALRGEVGSYRAVAAELSASVGRSVNRGFVCAVANGKRPAPNWLRLALGLKPVSVEVVPLSCGHAPVAKRCPYCQPRSTTPNARRKRNQRLEAMRAAVSLGRMLDGMTG